MRKLFESFPATAGQDFPNCNALPLFIDVVQTSTAEVQATLSGDIRNDGQSPTN